MKRLGVAMIAIGFGVLAHAGATEPVFTSDVAPILYKHCVVCHHPNDIAPMSLMTYSEVKPWAAAIREAVLTRKMPPWLADPRYGHWSNDARLSDAEIAVIRAWTSGAKPEGDEKLMPAAPTFHDGWKIGTPDVVIAIPPHKLDATGPDEYTYISVPTGFTEDRWVAAAELRPGNRRIVHHAHVFVEDPPEPAKTMAAKPPDPARAFTQWIQIHRDSLTFVRPDAPVIDDGCAIDDNGRFPGSKASELGTLISSYLPGREPDVYPEGTARLIRAGSNLKFQIHYSRTTGKPETDATSVGLIFAKQPPKQVARRIDLANHMFLIPAGDPGQEVTECHTFRKDMYITSLTPHMHLRGKAMRFTMTYPDGHSETLLDVPAYDFNWQITYRTAQPIFIPAGSRLKIDAHFDNSVNNPRNPDPTRTIRWGEASETEMMDGWVEFVDALPANAPTIAKK